MKQNAEQNPVILADDVDPDDNPDAHIGAEELNTIEDNAEPKTKDPLVKLETLPTFREIIRKLTAPSGDRKNPIPEGLLRVRVIAGGGKLSYIDWQTGVRLLNAYAPGWSYSVHPTEYRPHDGAVVVKVTLSIPTSDLGIVYRDGVGVRVPGDKGVRGDIQLAAEHQALKRAASKFGLGLYLYDKP